MEKYSAYRDLGTGIQPFLPPVPPQDPGALLAALKPICYLFGTFRTIIVLGLALLYATVVQCVKLLLYPVPPLQLALQRILTALLCRSLLFIVGVYWIPVEVVRRKRGRFAKNEAWSPKAGDMIVSNWISWLEVTWLASRCDPIFLLPVTDPVEKVKASSSSPSRVTPGRKTGTGSAAVSLPSQNRATTKRSEVRGFVEVSLLRMVFVCGRVPPYGMQVPSTVLTLDEALRHAKDSGRPLAIFPECTTSNGRGLLRFSNMLSSIGVPVTGFNIFLMCVRINPPTSLSPTLSLPIPSTWTFINPLPHIFAVSSTVLPHAISIRLLAPSESPGSPSFIDEVLPGTIQKDNVLIEVCSALISEIGRVKRTGMGWEDKSMFLEFYTGKGGK